MLYEIFLIIISVIFMAVLLIKRFIYFRPSKELNTPILNKDYDNIYENGLHGWIIKNDSSNKVILFCHGNGGNISHRQDKIAGLHQLGLSVLIFDYAGYGLSRGVPSEQAILVGTDIFYNFLLRKGYNKNNIIPYGESMGAFCAAYIARKYALPTFSIESGLPGVRHLITSMRKLG